MQFQKVNSISIMRVGFGNDAMKLGG